MHYHDVWSVAAQVHRLRSVGDRKPLEAWMTYTTGTERKHLPLLY